MNNHQNSTTDGGEPRNETTDGGKKMYCYEYPHPALTVDCVIFGFDGEKLNVLLVERGLEPYMGMWALPGGFVNIDETVEEAACRELMEETGIADMFLEQFRVFSAVRRDPRERVVTVAFLMLVSQNKCKKPRAGSDAKIALWFDESKLPPLAFDHREIIEEARRHLSEIIRLRPVAFRLLNKVFTVAELQKVYEIINRTQYDRRNFQRKLLQSDILDDRGIAEVKSASRPPRLYSLKPEIEREVERTDDYCNDSDTSEKPLPSGCDCCMANEDPIEFTVSSMRVAKSAKLQKSKSAKKDDGFSLRKLFEW